LIDKVWRLSTLQAAWQQVKANKGAAGIDRQSIEPKNGSYPAVVIRSDVIHGGSGRVIFATT
jgi:hypothetical protein